MSTLAPSSSTDSAVDSATASAHGTPAASPISAASVTSTGASLRRHAVLSDLTPLQMVTLMGTALLVVLGVVLGGRSYIAAVSPADLVSSQPGVRGASSEDLTDSSSPETV